MNHGDGMNRPEYRHYFCAACGQAKESLAPNGIDITWTEPPMGDFRCGDWSDKGTMKPGRGCGKPATTVMVGSGGNPITYPAK